MGTIYFGCTPYTKQMGVLAIAGDSITFGYGLSAGQAWGDQLATLVTARAYSNGGHSGEYSGDMLTHEASEILAHYSRVGHPVAILEIGSNDIASGLFSVGTLEANCTTWIAAAKAAGFLVGLCTILDRQGILTVSQGTFNANRATFNTWVRAGTGGQDFFVDFDTDSRLLNAANGTYYQDAVHPTAAGAAIMGTIGAAAVVAALP